MVSIGTRSSKNPLIMKWLQTTDPLLILLAFQLMGLLAQMLIFILPLNPKEEQIVTIVGAINFTFTLVNTVIFVQKEKRNLL